MEHISSRGWPSAPNEQSAQAHASTELQVPVPNINAADLLEEYAQAQRQISIPNSHDDTVEGAATGPLELLPNSCD